MIDEYIQYLMRKGYVESTRKAVRGELKRLYGYTKSGIHSTTEQITAYYNDMKNRGLTNRTIVGKMWRIKRYFRYLKDEGYILIDPAARIELIHTKYIFPHKIPSHNQIETLLSLPDTETLIGKRNRAILELLYSSGIRRKELGQLDIYDVDIKRRQMFIREGKGGRDRMVPIGEHAAIWLKKYIDIVRIRYLKDVREKALFLTVRGQRISLYSVFDVLQRYYKNPKVGIKISPHKLRHACAVEMLRNGADIRIIQELLGHRRLTTTQIYTQVSPEDLKVMHERYHPRRRMVIGGSKRRV